LNDRKLRRYFHRNRDTTPNDYGHLHVLTGIVYVHTVRFTDGTLWRVDPTVVATEVKNAAPRIKNAGPLIPDREKRDEKKP
jgi:hypothetical protein